MASTPWARRDRGHRAQNCKRPADVVGFDFAARVVGVAGRVGSGGCWVSLDRSIKCRHGRRKEQFSLISGRAPSAALSSTSLIASAMTFAASSSCHWRSSAGMGTAGQDKAGELTAGVDTTCTGVSGILRTVASCAAHRTATLDDGEPSTPTKTPGCAGPLDIRFASHSDRLP